MANKEFQVRHGLVVNNNVLVANTITGNVGIGTSNPAYSLDIVGTINASNVLINGGSIAANLAPAFNTANDAYTHSNATYAAVNSVFGVANAAFDSANNVAPQVAPAYNTANAAFGHSNITYNAVNSAFGVINAAYTLANTKYSSAGGTISGNVSILGDLNVHGNTYFIDQQTLEVSDPLIYLAGNNYVSDVVDIGFVANYVNTGGANVHTGLYRSAGTKEYYLFQGYDKEPDGNYIDPTGNNLTRAVLNSDIRTSNLNLAGANAVVWIRSAYDTVNAVYTSSNADFTVSNAAFGFANGVATNTTAAFGFANGISTNTTAAFAKANAALANTSGVYTAGNLNIPGILYLRGTSGATGLIDFTNSAYPGLYKNTAARFDFTSAGDKIANNPFWLGYHFATKDTITQSGVNTFPRASLYYTYTTPTDPTDLQFVLELGNAGSSTPHGLSFRAAPTGASNITMWTAGTERIRITSGGNIGIGNTAPVLKLEVAGNMSVDAFVENSANITTSYTITTGRNAMTAGPVTVNSGVTVEVPAGSTWTVV